MYSTTYALTWASSNPNLSYDEIVREFEKLPEWKDGGFQKYGDEIYIESAAWPDQMDDMYSLSKKFPNVLFTLWGNGEDADDLWEEHWQNGRFQLCFAEIPPYNPIRMEEYTPRKTQ